MAVKDRDKVDFYFQEWVQVFIHLGDSYSGGYFWILWLSQDEKLLFFFPLTIHATYALNGAMHDASFLCA